MRDIVFAATSVGAATPTARALGSGGIAKEHGILFSAPMVRALLAGTKTQTRRAFKDSPPPGINVAIVNNTTQRFGGPGDRLWVRETWMADPPIDNSWPSTQFAGCKPRDHSLIPAEYRKPEHCLYRADGFADLHGWTPAIHMFRWASRLTLEIAEVRVERLQEISAADAIAEGIGEFIGGWACLTDDAPQQAGATPQEGYRHLWERINGAGSWNANPWVWVVGFRVLPSAVPRAPVV